MVIKLMLRQFVDTERTIYAVTVDALMDSGAKMQFKVKMEMLLYIQEDIGRGQGTGDNAIEVEEGTCGKGLAASDFPSSK